MSVDRGEKVQGLRLGHEMARDGGGETSKGIKGVIIEKETRLWCVGNQEKK